jgi:GntR family transcriptional regulator
MMPHQQRFLVRPLFIQVRDEIALRIATGVWKPGTLLPNEVALATELGVSQGTMRKALDLLESEKIVTRQQGRGTCVVDHDTEEMAIRFSSIYNDRDQRISGHVVWSSAEESNATEVEQRALKVGPEEKIIRVHRLRDYHDHPFMYEISSLRQRFFPGIVVAEMKTAKLSPLAQKYGVQLSYAAEEVTPVLCPLDKLDKLKLAAPVPILFLNRTTFTQSGVPIEHRIAWCHLKEKRYMTISR